VTLNPSRNTLPLAQDTPRMLILTTSRAHNTPWLTTPETTKYSERITLVYRINRNQYKCNPIPLSLEKTKVEK